MSVEQRLQRLEDIEAIKQLIARYMTAADHNGDPKMMAACFTEDAVWNSEGLGHFETRDGIAQGLHETSTKVLSWALHYFTQPIIEIADDGQTATGEYYLWELAKAVQEDGSPDKDTWIGGWYESKFRKEDGEWKFSHIELILKLLSPADAASWETPIPPWKG
jgi:ketosteroid isomerase-like protein